VFLYTVGRIPWMEDQPVTGPLPIHGATQAQNKRMQTSTLRAGFETMTPAFRRTKTIHALDHGVHCEQLIQILELFI
jgi:hypothetical protein